MSFYARYIDGTFTFGRRSLGIRRFDEAVQTAPGLGQVNDYMRAMFEDDEGVLNKNLKNLYSFLEGIKLTEDQKMPNCVWNNYNRLGLPQWIKTPSSAYGLDMHEGCYVTCKRRQHSTVPGGFYYQL